jgi:cytoskeleton protein RodZ
MKKVRSMTDHEFLPPGRSDPAGVELTAGALLRQARQAQGMHLAALAASLKVPMDKLEALEQDRFDLLVDVVFVRALASGVCRLLKIDPTPILQRLPSHTPAKVVSQNRGINEPFRSRSGTGSSWGAQLSKPVIFVGLALLLGAAVLVFLPVIHKEPAGKLSGQEEAPAAPGTPSMVQEPVGSSVPAVPPVQPAPVGASPLPVPGPAPSPSELGASAPAGAASAPALGAPAGNASDARVSLVTFTARESSWVKVTDAKGVSVLGRTLQAGESVSVSGTLPLSAIVGRADVVQVQVRGQALDLNALAKSNVARFEVK